MNISNIRIAYLLLAYFCVFSITQAESLNVGVIAGFTGNWAPYGNAIRQGLELSQKELPQNTLKIFYEDDQFIPKNTVSAAKKLIDVSKVDVLIVGDSTTAKAVVGEVSRTNIPLIVWSSEDAAFYNKAQVFRTWTTLKKETRLFVQEIKKQKYQSVAVWAGPHVYAVGYAQSLKNALGNLVFDYNEFSENILDYRPYLLRLKEKKVEALGLCLNAGQHAVLLKQLHVLNIPIKLFGCNMLNYVDDIEALKKLGLHAWVFDSAISAAFREKYKKYSGSEEMLSTAAMFYDTGLILNKAAEIKSTKKISLTNAIASVGLTDGAIDGANGIFNIMSDGRQKYFDFKLTKIELP